MNQALLGSRIDGLPTDFEPLACGYTSGDLDAFAMDNGGTQKELVGRTYAGVRGHRQSGQPGAPGLPLDGAQYRQAWPSAGVLRR